MPNYWNSGNFYPAIYPQYYSGMPQMPQQSYANQSSIAAAWVEGEMEARGRQMPQGVNQFFMFDANKQKIYLKSLNQMGMPNPMQILNFTIDDQSQGNLPAGNSSSMSGNTMSGAPDMSQYVTKQDFDILRNEIQQMRQNQSGVQGNQNTSGNNYSNNTSGQNTNRGGNR